MKSRTIEQVGFDALIGAGVTDKARLTRLVIAELAALDDYLAAEDDRMGLPSQYLARGPEGDVARLLVLAAVTQDAALWRRVVAYLFRLDDDHRWEQRQGGVRREDLGPDASPSRANASARWRAQSLVASFPEPVASSIDAQLDAWGATAVDGPRSWKDFLRAPASGRVRPRSVRLGVGRPPR